ncbi:MAG: hypothetical protein WBQ18_20950 [Solirubrobacteraceae bacterium]
MPNSVIAGEPVLIYGQLKGSDHANKTIYLYHRINPNRHFSLISVRKTNSFGQYEFTRAEGVVLTNRSWFVRGPGFTHSRTVHERVAALVSLAASSPTGFTRHPIVFSGHVTPDHAGNIVLLQAQKGSSDDWRTIKRGRLDASSDYNIPFAWRVPGAYNVRVLFRRDARNVAAPSDSASVVIQQTEVPDFTIQTSDPIVANGQSATISGTLDQPGATTAEPSTSVSLFAAQPGTSAFHELTTTTTAADGSYSFANVSSTTNQLYQVRTTFAPARHTAVLFEGVQDVVTMQASSQTSTVGGSVTFSGNVSPDKAGHVIYLQRLGKDNDWHTVQTRYVDSASNYQFNRTFGTAGTKEFRTRITGGPANIGGASTPVTIDVTQPSLSSLPTG